MAKFIRVKTVPGQSDSLMQERDYYVNLDLITIVEQSPQSPDRSSLRFVGSDHGIHITESAENFFSRIGRE
jgi:hypothetical protein